MGNGLLNSTLCSYLVPSRFPAPMAASKIVSGAAVHSSGLWRSNLRSNLSVNIHKAEVSLTGFQYLSAPPWAARKVPPPAVQHPMKFTVV
jgi:hypothetical protein